MRGWIALDLETTGLSPTRHLIRELAAVPFAVHDRDEYFLRFAPDDFQARARRGTLTKWTALLEVIGTESVLVAHNAAFDLAFLAEALRRAGAGPFTLRAYCTLRLARRLLPDRARYDLTTLGQALQIDTGKPHTALADARAVAALFSALVQRAAFVDEEAIRALHGPPIQVRFQSGLIGRRRWT